MRIAIVGSGVSGLVCAHLLHPRHDVTLFEADSRAGGHAHTVSAEINGTSHAMDTGFIVYNERNYPILTQLFAELGVATQPSDMSFAMASDEEDVEWCGSSLASIFAQPRNILRPAFLRMLVDIRRFNRNAHRSLGQPENFHETLEDFLTAGGYSREFREWYLVPMGAAIWSADPTDFVKFPAAAFLRFFKNHGLLGIRDRPQWRTVVGGSVNYVNAITKNLGERVRLSSPVTSVARIGGGVQVRTAHSSEVFDHVIVATHSDQALALLESPTRAETEILSAIKYRANNATLHTDEKLMARRPRARASWNWRRSEGLSAPTLTYDLTRLEGLTAQKRVYLTLNQPEAIGREHVLHSMTYWHPVFDCSAMRAQLRHGEISGRDGISFVGAYWGFGFHEDGARSALNACHSLGSQVSESVS